jgi:toxin-antitoxin system PIN domain toxin
MLLLDVNVVLIAYRQDHADHAEVRPWFDAMLDACERFAVPSPIWTSFVRLATSRRFFTVPSTIAEAFDFIESTRAQPGHVSAEPGPRHLSLLRRLCDEADAAGDLVPDAVLGAIALEHGADVVTLDRDFARFSSVRHLRPSAPPPAPSL